MNSDAAMNDADVISFQGDTYPGSDKGNYVALVNASTNTAPGKVLSEYPLATAATNRALSHAPDAVFTKRARFNRTYSE